MGNVIELSKRFVVPMATVRSAPRMTMLKLPQWTIDGSASVADESRDDVPKRMTMSKQAPVARTTIGRQR